MSTHGYIGRTDTNDPSILHLRYVHSDANFNALLPTLQSICRITFSGDTAAMLDAVLASDWFYLNAATTSDHSGLSGDEPVPGIGVTLGGAPTGEPRQTTFDHLGNDGDGEFIYLIDPTHGVVSLHSPDRGALPLGRHFLTA